MDGHDRIGALPFVHQRGVASRLCEPVAPPAL